MRMARGTGIVQADAARVSRWLAGHLCYLHYRQRGPQEGLEPRRIFSATCDQVRHGEVLSALCGMPGPEVVVHKLVLSAEDEWVTDWRAWTRQVMCDLAEQEHPAPWFGVLHQNTAIPHVHIVLAGHTRPAAYTAITPRSQDGGTRPPLRPRWTEAFLGSQDHPGETQEAYP